MSAACVLFAAVAAGQVAPDQSVIDSEIVSSSVSNPAAPGNRPEIADPLAREQALTGTTGRLIVKFRDDSGLLAPVVDAPFPVYGESVDPMEAMAVELALLDAGGTMRRWIDAPESVLLDLMARAESNSGRPQPDLRTYAYVDVPMGRWFATLEALRSLEVVEWATFERTVIVSEEGQGCGGFATPDCEFPNPDCGIGAVGDCNPDPGCTEDVKICAFGCNNVNCCARVAQILPSCAAAESGRGWDQYCATIANIVCPDNQGDTSPGPFRPCFDQDGMEPYRYFLSTPCWMAKGAGRVGCNDTDCCLRVCEIDPFCCTLEWDSACVELAAGNGVDTIGVCFDAPDPGAATPDFTASVVSVVEELEDGTTYQAFRARGLQTYTVGVPVVGFPGSVVIPDPLKPGMEFLETGFKGWGLDLEQVAELQLLQRGETGAEAYLYGEGVRIGVIDFAYIPHEEFTCEVAGVGGQCRQAYATPRVIPEEGQTQLDDLPAAEKWHGTACLGMLVAGDNGFGITGIAKNAQGYFYPLVSAEQGFRLQNAVISMAQEFEAGDVCLLPVALAPDGGVGPNEIFSQPLTLNPAYRSLLNVAVDLGITCVLPAGNDATDVVAEEAPGIVVVAASYPGAFVSNGAETGGGIGAFSRLPTSNFTQGNTVDLFAWGSNIVTTGGFPDLFNGGPNRTYTKTFGGTSGAASMIAGATAVLSGVAKQRFFGVPASPVLLERVMRNNGIPQQGGPFSGGKDILFAGARGRAGGVGQIIADFPDIYADAIDAPEFQARLGFSDFNRANFVQLVDAANDLFLEADDCVLLGTDPAPPEPDDIVPFGPDGDDNFEIEVILAGGIGNTGDNCPWTAFSNVDWIVPIVASGTGAELDNIAVFEILSNPETETPRTGQITITGGNGTVVFPIVQNGCSLLGTLPDPVVYAAGGDENELIELLFNGDTCGWTASTDAEWLVLLASSGTGAPFDNRIELDVLPNNETEGPREDIIVVTMESGEEFDVVVVQEACGLLEVVPDAPVFGPDGSEESEIELIWNGDGCAWTAVSEVPWIELIIDSGTGEPFDNVVRYQVLGNNDTQVPRQGTIVVTSGAGTEFDLTVTQAPCTLIGTVPGVLAFGPDGAEKADIELLFDGEVCGWTAVSEVPWIELIVDSGTGVPFDNVVVISVTENNDTQVPREGTIVVTTTAGTEFDLAVAQAPCTLVETIPGLAPVFGPDGSDQEEFELLWDGEACAWSAVSNVPWIELIVDSGTGAPFENLLRYAVQANGESVTTRDGEITVISAAGTEFALPIEQLPCAIDGFEPPAFTDALEIDYPGATELTGLVLWTGETCEWTASTPNSWIELVDASGSGAPGENVFTFNVESNPSESQRTGQIVFSGPNGASEFVVVRQAASPEYTAAYQVVSGTEVTPNDVNRILEVDNIAVEIASQIRNAGGTYSGLTYPAGGWATDLYLITTYDPATWVEGEAVQLNSLQVEIRSRCNQASIIRFIYLKNRSTGEWTYMSNDFPLGQQYPGDPPFETFVLPDYLNAADFVNVATGRVDVRVLTFAPGTTPAYRVDHDLVRVTRVQVQPFTSDPEAGHPPTLATGSAAGEQSVDAVEAASVVTVGPEGLSQVVLGPDPVLAGRLRVSGDGRNMSRLSARSDAEWLVIQSAVQSKNGEAVEIRYEIPVSNAGSTPRSTVIDVTFDDGSSISIPFVQLECRLGTTDAIELEMPSGGAEGVVAVLPWNGASCDWWAEADVDWLRLTPGPTGEADDHGLVVAAPVNTSGRERQAKVRIVGPHGVVQWLTVRQPGQRSDQMSYEVVAGVEMPPAMVSYLEESDDVPLVVEAVEETSSLPAAMTAIVGGWITDVVVRVGPSGAVGGSEQVGEVRGIISRAASTRPGTARVVYLLNHDRGAWEYVDHDELPVGKLSDVTFEVLGEKRLDQYRDRESGLYSIRILTFGLEWSYTVFHDHVGVVSEESAVHR